MSVLLTIITSVLLVAALALAVAVGTVLAYLIYALVACVIIWFEGR